MSLLQKILLALFTLTGTAPLYANPDPADWQAVVAEASGQELFFYAWAGEQRTNDYLAWVATELRRDFDIRMTHVRLSDTAEATARVLAEKQAGNLDRGAVDLLWINGENFASMKANGLLFGPWAEQLPNFALTNPERYPDVRLDFTETVDGLESPWLRAHLVFYYDSEWVSPPPDTMAGLLDWAQQHPGEFTYPQPPNFLGTTFLKQALLELGSNSEALYAPANEADVAQVTAPLWTFLDALHPHLLRQGRSFPATGSALHQLMMDGEISLALSFNPTEAVNSVLRAELPNSVRTHIPQNGTLANVSFVAIPFNASHKAAAMVAANFLLSPAAQLRAQDPAYLGSTAVIDVSLLNAEQQRQFEHTRQSHPSGPPAGPLNKTLSEPHPSWMPILEREWLQRYGRP